MTVAIFWTIVVVPGLPLLLVLIGSLVYTAAGRRCFPSFYEKDRCGQPGTVVKRQYRGPGHVLFRLLDLLGYTFPLLRVYVLRTLSPAFREKIMITTAMANRCAQ